MVELKKESWLLAQEVKKFDAESYAITSETNITEEETCRVITRSPFSSCPEGAKLSLIEF